MDACEDVWSGDEQRSDIEKERTPNTDGNG